MSATALPRLAIGSILAISGAIIAFLLWILYFKPEFIGDFPSGLSYLPTLNAMLNATCAFMLIRGLMAIRRGRQKQHILWISGALCASAMFFISYITYHHYHGDTKFMGQGLIRPVYFFILISHIGLSMAVLPLLIATITAIATGRKELHKKLARRTWPIWLYVSITGVVIYIMLKIWS